MRLAGLALVVVVLGVATWALLGAIRPPPVQVSDSETRLSEPRGPTDPSPATPDTGGEAPARGGCRLLGSVTRDDRPIPARIEVYLLGIDQPGSPIQRQTSSERRLCSPVAPGQPIRDIRTDDRGRFEVRGLTPGRYHLVADSGAGSRGYAVAHVVHGMFRRLDIAVRGGPELLAGRAVYADGRPFAGIVWAERKTMYRGEGAWCGLTDAEGRFRLEGLEPGTNTLSFLVPGVCRFDVGGIEVPGEGETHIVVDAGLAEVRGRVVADDDESPVAGAEIEVSAQNRERKTRLLGRTATDADGRFATRMPGRSGHVSVRATGFAPGRVSVRGESELEVRLERRGTIVGLVTSATDGRPIAGVPVHGRSLRRDLASMNLPGGRAVTDEEGRYRLENVGPGSVSVRVAGGGWISEDLTGLVAEGLERRDVEVTAGATVRHDLVVVPAGCAEGRVVAEGGESLAGALITAATPMTWTGYRARGMVVSDVDGRFRFEDLVPGFPYEFTANMIDQVPGRAGPFRAIGGEAIDVEIIVPRARWLEVRVVDAEGGAGLEGVRIEGRRPDVSGDQRFSQAWVTGSEGTVRIGPLFPGSLLLTAHRSDCVAMSEPVAVDPAAERVDLALTRGLVIAGVVRCPVPPARGYSSLTLRMTPEEGEGSRSRHATVRRDGTFRYDGIAAGAYVLRLAAGYGLGGAPLGEWTVNAGREDVVLPIDEIPKPESPFGKSLTLHVRGPDDRPVSSGRYGLTWEGGGGQRGGFQGGDVEIRGQRRSGSVRIEVFRTKDADGNRLGAARLGPVDPSSGELTIRLPAARAIEGRVEGPEGRAVEGAVVHASPARPGQDRMNRDPTHATGRSDVEGRFRLEGLGEGRHWLHVEPPAGFAPVPPESAEAGQLDVVVRLPSSRDVTVSVLDTKGRPVAGARVGARAGRAGAEGLTDAGGKARLAGLDPEKAHWLSVMPPRGREDLARGRIREWFPADTEFRLLRSIRGVVLDPAGRGLSDVLVWSRTTDGKWYAMAQVAADGSFVHREVDEPTVALTATVRGARPEESEFSPVMAAEGATDVVLRLDPGLTLEVVAKNATRGGWAELRAEGEGTTVRRIWPKQPGRYRFSGLKAGERYTLRIVGDGASALMRKGLRAEAGRLEVTLVAGLSIRGQFTVPAGTERVFAKASSGGLTVRGKASLDGSFEIQGLCEGVWTVEVSAGSGPNRWRGSAEVEAGGEAEIDVVPDPR